MSQTEKSSPQATPGDKFGPSLPTVDSSEDPWEKFEQHGVLCWPEEGRSKSEWFSLTSDQVQMMSSLGVVKISVDPEYDEYAHDYLHERKYIADFQKNLKALVGHFQALTSSLLLFSNDMGRSYPDGDAMREYLSRIGKIIEEFDESDFRPFLAGMDSEAFEPLGEFQKQFVSLKRFMNARENKKIAYDNRASAVRRMVHKAQKDPHRLPREKERLRVAASEYQSAATEAKTQLVTVLDSVPKLYDPMIVLVLEKTSQLCVRLARCFEQIGVLAEEIEGRQFERTPRTVTPLDLEVDLEARPRRTPGSAARARGRGRGRGAPPAAASPGAAPAAAAASVPAIYRKTEWYYLDDAKAQQGPNDFDGLKGLYEAGTITNGTHVFGGDLTDWKTVGELPGMLAGFQ